MHESMEVFEKVSNHHCFARTPIIVFFNKIDLFREKIIKKPLNVCFPEYNGDNTYASSIEYLEVQFGRLAKTKHTHFFHVCAIETESVKFVLNNVLDIITTNFLSK